MRRSGEATDAALRIEGLRKSYGSRVAVDGVSFEVRRGETFGLLGPNGAGKSSTLHMMAGLLRPDAGQIVMSEAHGDPRKSLGLAPQSLSLYPDLTAEENCRFFGQLYGLRGARLKSRVEGVLELAGLQERRKDRVETYSGGMQRRLNRPGPRPSSAAAGRAHRGSGSTVTQPHLRKHRDAEATGKNPPLHDPLHGRGAAVV